MINTNDDTILIIDDEAQIRKLLDISFAASGYKVIEVATGRGGIQLAASHHPSLIVLDLGLPDMDGMEVLQQLRGWYVKPIIILSARNSEGDIVLALDKGANDYLCKPFRTGELLARIRVSLRSNPSVDDETTTFNVGNLSIDTVNHIAKKNDALLNLTPTEFSLLGLFVRNQGRVLTHQYILKEIWGYNNTGDPQSLRVFIAQLRKKIEDDSTKPTLLVTESGIGYRFGS